MEGRGQGNRCLSGHYLPMKPWRERTRVLVTDKCGGWEAVTHRMILRYSVDFPFAGEDSFSSCCCQGLLGGTIWHY